MATSIWQQLIRQLCCGLLLLFAGNVPAATLAGTLISNQAQVTYVDSVSGKTALLLSNVVETRVQQVSALLLTAPQTRSVIPGGVVYLPHLVRNTGNGPEAYTLAVVPATGTLAISNIGLYPDLNADGIPDSLIPITATSVLAPGATYGFVVGVRASTAALATDLRQMNVTASSTLAPAITQTNVDLLTISSRAVLTITKAYEVIVGPSPNNNNGNNILNTLTITNIGDTTATNVTLTDVLGSTSVAPAFDSTGLGYVAATGRMNGVLLSDTGVGNPVGVSYSATTVGTVTTVRAVLATLAPGASAQLTYRFGVLTGLPNGSLRSNGVATLSYGDGSPTLQTQNSNQAVYTVVGSALAPDYVITRNHTGNFTTGIPGTLNLLVNNIGPQAGSGILTVTDILPAGLVFTPTGSGGNGWLCSAVGQVVTCNTSTVVLPGTSAPPLSIVVTPNATAVAASPVTCLATVSGGAEPPVNAFNNNANDVVIVGLAATASGNVWLDGNHNGIFDAGEPGVAGWQAELLDSTGAVVKTALTAASGAYSIGPVPPGNGYQLRFRDPTTNIMYASPVIGDGTVLPAGGVLPAGAAVQNGTITALNLTPGANVVELSLPLDPSGVIYDAITRQPIPGASITLTCPTCAPAFNPAIHLFGGAAAQTQVVGVNGYYQYLLLPGFPAGQYLLQVTPPAGYTSPSTLIPVQPTALTPPVGNGFYPVQAQGTAPAVGSPTTYYLSFNIFPGMLNIINNHIPLDPLVAAGAGGLLVSKTASRTTAEPGDFIDYTVVVKNTTAAALTPVMLIDDLPRGFTYEPGTTRLDLRPLAEPLGGRGPRLTFNLGSIVSNGSVTLTYRVRIGVTAVLGTGINSAQASSGLITSNISRARVQINQGVFTDLGYIIGTVYMDCNRNRIQDQDEPGIPGVRLFLENGINATTDTDGKYSFYGVEPRNHHLKLDSYTLPLGAQLEVLANRNAGVAGGRFVDLQKAELHRADFASDTCSADVMKEVQKRHSKDSVTEVERMLKYRLNPSAAILTAPDARALPATGEVSKLLPTQPATGSMSGESYQSLSQATGLNALNSNLPALPVASVVSVDLNRLLLEVPDNQLDFLDLRDQDVLPMPQTTVRVKGPLGTQFHLLVNGALVPDTRVGKRSSLADKQLEAWEYIGVVLQPGENVLTLQAVDPFGNVRGERKLTLIAPDQLASIQIDAAPTIEANGRVALPVQIRLVDSKGVPVTSRTYLTLEATQGVWQVEDLDKKEPGVQVVMEHGQATFNLLPPSTPGQEVLRISSGVLKAEQRIAYLPELRPLLVSGIVEGAINTHSLNAAQLQPATAQDGFQQQIQRLSRGNAAVRGAMFLKGKVKGEYLLTLAYDSDKNVRDRLFRDIQPDEFYPVYGDSSVKGFDAQSTGRLYVRVDKGKSYLLYGDFLTQNMIPARSLSQYSRSLTGLKEHYESGRVMVNAFASQDTLRQLIQEIPADGTSGPFQLNNNGAMINSEKVEILTRDRNQPALILQVTPMARFTDYEVEQFTGRILFKGPVASLDANLNPRSIRVTYEVDQGGKPYWLTGVDAQVKLTDVLEVGGVMVQDSNPLARANLTGGNVTVKLAERTTLLGEVAHTSTLLGAGNAQRVELRQDAGAFQGRVYSGRSDATFDNASSILNKGRMEAGAKGSYRLNQTTTLTGEYIDSGDRLTGATRKGVLLKAEKIMNDWLRLEVGLRDSKDNSSVAGALPLQVTSARIKATAQVPQVKGLSVNSEFEQDVRDRKRRVFAIGADYQLMNRGRLYGRHEFISSLNSPFALNNTQVANTTVIGLDTDYNENTRMFSEYRARGVMDGRQAEAAVGLRNKWQVAEGLRLNTSMERVNSLAGASGRNAQAYTAALEYTRDPFWKGSARMEFRNSDTSAGWLNSLDVARRLTDSWTLLGKQVFSETANKGAASGSRLQHRLLVGLAWREMEAHDWNLLSKFEHRRESDSTVATPFHRVMDILSLHVNYQADSDWQASGHYAAKWLTDNSMGLSSRSHTQLVSGRVIWDITERWDAGVQASAMGDGTFRQVRYGLGAEVGYLLQENLWLSVGYNLFGFKDVDLIAQNATDKGAYVRLRFKFDEDLFNGGLNGREDRTPARSMKP